MRADNPLSAGTDFFRIPPFSGAKVTSFAKGSEPPEVPTYEVLLELLRSYRVVGNYWRPLDVEAPHGLLVRTALLPDTVKAIAKRLGQPVDWRPAPGAANDVDPWSLLQHCAALVCEADDPARWVAALRGLPVFCGTSTVADENTLDHLVAYLRHIPASLSPFDGKPMSLASTIGLCGFWRSLIESNRDLVGALGFAFWKQDSVAPLLWGGEGALPFWRKAPEASVGGAVAVWRSKAPEADIESLEARGIALVEVEDGFLRSAGLGADCVPPLSITVDRCGAYFDPSVPSELELLLETADFDADTLGRARRLREVIVEAGLGKYERGTSRLPRFAADRPQILVPGQVEDDRSVLTGGGGMSNLELLRRVRAANSDAFILYKPHPDVEAGHRRGIVSPAQAAGLADRVITDLSIASLLDGADEVHVNTSLAGFEALMRGKPVTTHGVPFYAGWGLTTDLGAIPFTRTRRRTLDELVAATLLVYPRYLDPLSGLPCPAEVVVERLIDDRPTRTGMIVRARRWQGMMIRQWRKLMG